MKLEMELYDESKQWELIFRELTLKVNSKVEGKCKAFHLSFSQARQLIEEGSVINVIIDTVMDMLRAHLDNNNHFQFQGHNPDKFFRVQVIFHDLRSTHNP